MKPRPSIGLAVAACVAACLVVGCGAKTPKQATGSTPQETALQFGEALQEGKPDVAAAYWAYTTEARAQNEDWGSIPPGQRSEIVGKLREQKTTELEALVGPMKAAQGELQASAQDTSVTLSAGGAPVLVVTCAKTEDGYQVLAAARPGQPPAR